MTPRFWYVRGLTLNDALRQELQREGRVERWGHRAAVQLRDDPDEVQTVLDGRLTLADGEFAARPLLTRGDVFGLLTPETPGELLALDDLKIATVPRQSFEELVNEQVGALSANVGLVRRHHLSVPAPSLWYSTPRRRVAALLLQLIETLGESVEETGRLNFVPSTKILARVTGLADRTVAAILEDMRQHNILIVHRGRLDASLEPLRAIAIA